MISIDKITKKIIQLDEYLSVLNELSKISKKDFLNDKILMGSAKYYLQVSIECCLDIANHIIATQRYRAPESYADTFTVLTEEALLSLPLAEKMRQMAKFRNRLVHLYSEIDNQFVYQFMLEDVDDIHAFRKVIIQHYRLKFPNP